MENSHLSSVTCKTEESNWKEKSLELLRNFSIEKKLPESLPDVRKKREVTEKKLVELLDEIKRVNKELDIINSGDEDFIEEKCNLYEKITNITWDLDSVPSDVRGYVSDPFNVFHLNTETNGKFDISNHLWNLISGKEENFPFSPLN